MDVLLPILQDLVSKYPVISTIVFVIGVCRVVIKPLMSVARAVVDLTPNQADNAKLDEVEASSAMKTLLYVLDWFASIKLGSQAK